MDRKVLQSKAQARQNQALALHIKGHPIPSIRKALNYASDNGVKSAIRRAAARQSAAPVDQARNEERLHLQFLRKQTVDVIIDPEPGVGDTKLRGVEAALKISQRMAGLMGLDSTTTDNDENAVDMWLFEIGGGVEVPVEFTDEDDLDEEPDDLALDAEEEDFED